MNDARHIAENYIAVWNETDSAKRAAQLRQNWSNAAVYTDPMAKASGSVEIDALIGGVQARFPGFRFALTSDPNGHGEFIRFSWSLGPAGTEAPIEGSDVVVMHGERIGQVIGFLDKVP